MVILIVLNGVALAKLAETGNALELQRKATVKTKNDLRGASERLQRLETEKTSVSASLKKEQSKSKRLERENAQLKAKKEARLAAQREQARLAAQQATVETPNPASAPVAVSGSCASWIASAGISDVANAKDLIQRESGCNPNAVNPSSGACGVAQELPCGKSGCSLGDGACQVAWMKSYVLARYGSFANAIAHHNANNWY